MIEVKRPELLTASLAVSKMLHPSKGSLKLQMDDVSECSLTLEDTAETIPMHGWVRIYNHLGFVGYFRRTGKNQTVTADNSYTLRHGIDILQDSIWDAETTFSGTVTEFLTALLAKQTNLIQGPGDNAPRAPWALGTVSDTSTYKKDINYENLLDLMQEMAKEKHGYYFTYDQTVWPWTVSFVAKPSAVASEFRLNRNIEKCQIKDNDAELCTRLLLSVNQMVNDADIAAKTGKTVQQNATVVRTYNNTTAQASYGVIVKTADINVTGDTFPNGPFPEADAWAADFLARRAAPLLQVEIDGQVLKGITGSTWDESRIGAKVRVALPDYSTAIEERCVTVNYPEIYGTPEKVTVSLANSLPTFTNSIRSTNRTVSRNSRSSRRSERKEESFEKHFTITDDSGDVLRQAGMKLDASGLLVYADDEVNMVGARFNVQADQIGMVVGTNEDGNYIKAGEICLSINNDGTSEAKIWGSKVTIGNSSTASVSIADAFDIETYAGVQSVKLKKQMTTYENVYVLGGNLTVSALNNAGGTFTGHEVHVGTNGSLVFDDRNASTPLTRTDALGIVDTYGHVALSLSGNTYTLWYLPANKARTGNPGVQADWISCGTFSRATTLSGEWGSGTLTITASPQDDHLYVGLFDLRSQDIVWNSSKTSATISVYANLNGGETRYDTGKRLTVSAPSLSWSYQSAISPSSSDPGNVDKTYSLSSGYEWGKFWVDVNGTKKYIKIHITS